MNGMFVMKSGQGYLTDKYDASVVLINSDAAMDRVENPEQVSGAVEGISGEWIQVLRIPGTFHHTK